MPVRVDELHDRSLHSYRAMILSLLRRCNTGHFPAGMTTPSVDAGGGTESSWTSVSCPAKRLKPENTRKCRLAAQRTPQSARHGGETHPGSRKYFELDAVQSPSASASPDIQSESSPPATQIVLPSPSLHVRQGRRRLAACTHDGPVVRPIGAFGFRNPKPNAPMPRLETNALGSVGAMVCQTRSLAMRQCASTGVTVAHNDVLEPCARLCCIHQHQDRRVC